MDNFWGVVISVQLFAVMVQNLWRIVADWGRPHPITTIELLSLIESLGLSANDVEAALKKSHLEMKVFIVEEMRKKDKREFDKQFNEKRGGENEE